MEVKKLWKFLEDMPFSKNKWLAFKKRNTFYICSWTPTKFQLKHTDRYLIGSFSKYAPQGMAGI
jgi:hypothetical protein